MTRSHSLEFQNLVLDISREVFKSEVPFGRNALLSLQQVVEQYHSTFPEHQESVRRFLEEVLQDSLSYAQHACRMTIHAKDIMHAVELQTRKYPTINYL